MMRLLKIKDDSSTETIDTVPFTSIDGELKDVIIKLSDDQRYMAIVYFPMKKENRINDKKQMSMKIFEINSNMGSTEDNLIEFMKKVEEPYGLDYDAGDIHNNFIKDYKLDDIDKLDTPSIHLLGDPNYVMVVYKNRIFYDDFSYQHNRRACY